MDYLTNNIMLPFGGLFVAVLVGWLVPEKFLKKNLNLSGYKFKAFYFFLRFIAPFSITLVFLYLVF